MKVLIVNTSERTGGAAVAANRLMKALNNNGVKVKMLVRDKDTDALTVVPLSQSWRLRWHFLWERLVVFCHLHFSRTLRISALTLTMRSLFIRIALSLSDFRTSSRNTACIPRR